MVDGRNGGEGSARSGNRSELRAPVADAVALAGLTGASTVPYVGSVGFYSDDWAFLAALSSAPDRSLPGLVAALHGPNLTPRPVQRVLHAGLYALFGHEPLGHHLFNVAALVALALLLLLALRELGLPRVLTVAVPALFVVLPGYSADRFWPAAFGYTVAMAFWAGSLYANLRSVRGAARPHRGWKAAGLAALAASGLGHEVALPLLAATPVAVAVVYRRRHGRGIAGGYGPARTAALLLPDLVAVAAIVAFKRATFTGTGPWLGFTRDVARATVGIGSVHFGTFGLDLGSAVRWALANASPAALVVAAAVAVALGVHLRTVLGGEPDDALRRVPWPRVVGLGLVVYLLGVALFVVTPRFSTTSTGIGNRVGIAGALGAAVCFVGAVGWVASRLPGRARHPAFAVAIAVLCAGNLLVVATLGQLWAAAWQRQRTLLAQIEAALPTLPEDATVLLAGACRYVGPGVVFESSWDLAGALATRYGEPSLRADVVADTTMVRDDAVVTVVYGTEVAHPFGPAVLGFDARDATVTRVTDRSAAESLLASSRQAGCPPVPRDAHGVAMPFDRTFQRLRERYFPI